MLTTVNPPDEYAVHCLPPDDESEMVTLEMSVTDARSVLDAVRSAVRHWSESDPRRNHALDVAKVLGGVLDELDAKVCVDRV